MSGWMSVLYLIVAGYAFAFFFLLSEAAQRS